MIELYEHNTETYKRLCDTLQQNNKCALIQATGTGKSYIVGKYIENYGNSVLILVPSNAIGNAWIELLNGIEKDIDVVTYQAFSRDCEQYKDYDLVIADEMHHLGSEVWGKKFVESYLQSEKHKIIGLTATEIRYLDNSRDMADEIFDNIRVDGCDLPTAINNGILPTFKYVSALYCDESDFDEWRGKIDKISDKQLQKELKGKLEVSIKNMVSVKQAIDENLTDEYKKIIVFLNMVETKEKALVMFREIFPNANFYDVDHSKWKTENDRQIENFKKDENRAVLFAVDMLNEGIHIKGTDCVIMFRKTISPQVYLQQLGRGIASGNDKPPIVFDLVSNINNINQNSKENNSTNIIKKWNKNIISTSSILVKNYISDLENVLFAIQDKISRHHYTEYEDNFLKENYGILTTEQISEKLCRPVWSIRKRLRHLGITDNKRSDFYTDEEISFLKENFGKMSYEEMAIALNRTASGINYKCAELGMVTKTKHIFTEEEDLFIKNNYLQMSYFEIAEKLKLKPEVVRTRAKHFNLRKQRQPEKYTEQEDKIIIENYRKIPASEIAKKIGKTALSVNQRASRLGITKVQSLRWTEDEISFLIENYGKIINSELSKKLNRTIGSVLKKASKLGLMRNREEIVYSEVEDDFIRENWLKLTSYEISQKLNRSRGGVRKRAEFLGVTKVNRYSEEEIEYIKQNYGNMRVKDIAESLKRTPKSVSTKCSELGLVNNGKKEVAND